MNVFHSLLCSSVIKSMLRAINIRVVINMGTFYMPFADNQRFKYPLTACPQYFFESKIKHFMAGQRTPQFHSLGKTEGLKD